MKTLSNLVQEKRKSANMSQAVLAAACGVSERTVIRVESGERPSPETLMALCSVLKISPEAARAAMPDEDARPGKGKATVRVVPTFGQTVDEVRARSAALAVERNPDATHVAAPDLEWGLATPEGRKWTSLAKLAEGNALRAAIGRRALASERAVYAPYNPLILPATLMAALGACAALVYGMAVASMAWPEETMTCALIGLAAMIAAIYRLSTRDDAQGELERAATLAMAASANRIALATGERVATFEAATCRRLSIDVEPDGRHMTMEVVGRDDERSLVRWLPAEPGLRATLEAFRANIVKAHQDYASRREAAVGRLADATA